MDLIHARTSTTGDYLTELNFINDYESLDIQHTLNTEPKDNDFELILSKEVFNKYDILEEDWLYLEDTDWVVKVLGIEHITNGIKVTGLTVRGLQAKLKIYDVAPITSNKDAYKTFAPGAFNTIFKSLLDAAGFGSDKNFISVDTDFTSKTTKTYKYRFTNLVKVIDEIIKDLGYIPNYKQEYTSDSKSKIILKPIKIKEVDSAEMQLTSDYSVEVTAKKDKEPYYNVLIALGKGELGAREVIRLKRDEEGKITVITSISPNDTVYLYENSSAETVEELREQAEETLAELTYLKEINMAIEDSIIEYNLGDIVYGYDEILNMEINAYISKKTIKINSSGININYNVTSV